MVRESMKPLSDEQYVTLLKATITRQRTALINKQAAIRALCRQLEQIRARIDVVLTNPEMSNVRRFNYHIKKVKHGK